MPNVAVVGASLDRAKFGNKAVRAYLKQGYEVFPVNPRESRIEGLQVYRSVLDIPVPLDRVTVYLPAPKTARVLEDIAKKAPKELFLNPGTESEEVIKRAGELGLKPILACSIVAVGESPGAL